MLVWRKITRSAAAVLTWAGLVVGILPLITPLAKPLGGRVLPAVNFVRFHSSTFWLAGLSIITIALLLWITSLQRRFATKFKDDFKKPINLNWDYRGNWHVGDVRTLVVTESPDGGLTKVGTLWENYTLRFQAKIVRDCLGVVVRARDLDNYYMFQIRADCIRPHRRVALPVQLSAGNDLRPLGDRQQQPSGMQVVPVPYIVVWQVMDEISVSLRKQLTTWFSAEIAVQGESVQIRIDDELVFEHQSLLKNATGKIGFRNNGAETAMVRRIRVQVMP